MALTPTTVRLDLKCGKGSISKGEKCHKGTATAARKKNEGSSLLTKAAIVGGAALAVGGIAYGARKYGLSKKLAAEIDNPTSSGAKPTPDETISRGRGVFKEARKIATGAQVAGAGLALAGAGLYNYGKEKKNAAASVAGAGLTVLGLNTVMGGHNMRRVFKENEQEFEVQAGNYRRQYYQAQEEARRRHRASGNAQGGRNVGTNNAVKDPFKDLGVDENASDAEIKKIWLKLMRQNHPDAGGDPEKAKKYNAAYQEILRRRGKFDSVYADGFDIDWDAIMI